MEQQYDQEQMDRLREQFYDIWEASLQRDPNDYTACDEFIAAAPEIYRIDLHMSLCLEMVGTLTRGYLRYGDDKTLRRLRALPGYAKFKSELAFLDADEAFYKLFFVIDDVLHGKANSIMPRLTQWLQAMLDNAIEDQRPFNWAEFTTLLVIPLKEGVPGMWTAIGEMMKGGGAEKGLAELCFALEKVYYSADNDEIINALLTALRTNDSLPPARELLGYTYYNMKLWSNALAWFEQAEDADTLGMLFFKDDELFWMAWCYGKRKDYVQEETYYRKSLELNPTGGFSLNNLGYCLYKQKKYGEAKEVFQRCIRENLTARYAANNLVRTLLAMGDWAGARAFIADSGQRVSKELIARAERASDRPEAVPAPDDEAESPEAPRQKDAGVKKQQFTSEKLLEDELILRMEAGMPVFGLPLKVYRKRGVYGRQFVIPNGRMDILAVDEAGDYYVIELKKDAGYDDAYLQTREYIDWAERHLASDGQRVFGIICLNSPPPKLVQKIREDQQMRLFEYAISYTEIK